MNSRQLPKGWVEKKLGDICSIKHGFAFKSQFFTSEESDYVLLTPGSFYESGGYREQGEKTKYYIGKIPDGFILNKNDFLFAMTEQAIGLLGSPLIVPELNKFLHNQRLGLVQVFDRIDWHNDFFFYQFNTQEFRAAVQSSASGVKVRHTSPNKLGAISIRYPPSIVEQKAIADNLNEAFAGIDRAIANTKKNLTNTRELFESYLDAIFTRKGDGWIEEKLHSVVEPNCSLSYGIVQPGNEYEDGLPIVRPTDLTKKNINLDGLKRIDPSLADSYKRTKLSGGELLLCVRGSNGVVGIAVDELKGANVTRGIVPIRFERSVITQAFGYYLLISKMIQDQIREKTYGTALMQINIRDLKNILISFPDQEEQQILVEKLTQMENETQRLEAIYQQKLAALTELKQSILQKAFTGELTADTANQTTKKAEEAIAA